MIGRAAKPAVLRATGLVLGFVADRVLGDPRRFHPVAGFGRAASSLEKAVYADSRIAGSAYTAMLVGAVAAGGLVVERSVRDRPLLAVLVTAGSTWTVLGGRSLEREAMAVGALLDCDLPAARIRLTHLVGRDPSRLEEPGIARAVVESVAENTSDAVVAALVLGGVLGVPGLLGYRAANTLDAMVGHRSARYTNFGWASARLDDLLNLPGSRVSAGLAVLLAEDRSSAVRAWRRDARHHPSPNAGPIEAAFAGGLGLRLGGVNTYPSGVEDRAVLGDGRPPATPDIERATRLARRIGRGAVLVAVGISLALRSDPRPDPRSGRQPRQPPARQR